MSRTLLLARHGAYDVESGSLTTLGHQQIDSIARQFVAEGFAPDIIIHSEEKRAVESARRIQAIFSAAAEGKTIPLQHMPWLDNNSTPSMELVRQLPDDHSFVMGVSHKANVYALQCYLALNMTPVNLAQARLLTSETAERWADFGRPVVYKAYTPQYS